MRPKKNVSTDAPVTAVDRATTALTGRATGRRGRGAGLWANAIPLERTETKRERESCDMMSLVKIRHIAEIARASSPATPEPAEPSFQSLGRSAAVRSQRSLPVLVPLDSVFKVGQRVQVFGYWSSGGKLWLPAEVLEVDARDGMVRIKPVPVRERAPPWVHPRGHAPYIDGYDRKAIRPKPKESVLKRQNERVPLVRCRHAHVRLSLSSSYKTESSSWRREKNGRFIPRLRT